MRDFSYFNNSQGSDQFFLYYNRIMFKKEINQYTSGIGYGFLGSNAYNLPAGDGIGSGFWSSIQEGPGDLHLIQYWK